MNTIEDGGYGPPIRKNLTLDRRTHAVLTPYVEKNRYISLMLIWPR
jgi:hypothetical protein